VGSFPHSENIIPPNDAACMICFIIAVDVDVRFGGDESPKELVANVQQFLNMDHLRFCFG